jgi:hypothetical protein
VAAIKMTVYVFIASLDQIVCGRSA